MQIVATKAFAYAGRRLQPGDSFDASAKHARILITIGSARAADVGAPVEPSSAPARRQYRRRDMTAAA